MGLKHTTRLWILVYLAFEFLPVLFNLGNCKTLIEFFIPIAGRSGADKSPDYTIALMTAAATIICVTFLVRLWFSKGLDF